jgi:hypothetical protein
MPPPDPPPLPDAIQLAGLPRMWAELIYGLSIMAPHGGTYPTHCEHDVLTVCANPSAFTGEQLDLLDDLGFHRFDDGGDYFKSFRFGSA